jgi:hypothetical protein
MEDLLDQDWDYQDYSMSLKLGYDPTT